LTQAKHVYEIQTKKIKCAALLGVSFAPFKVSFALFGDVPVSKEVEQPVIYLQMRLEVVQVCQRSLQPFELFLNI
jgi:uncharacterized metal-binding protein YceD (DUF177 family)